jgi:uncharacterized protein (DUF1800 family)
MACSGWLMAQTPIVFGNGNLNGASVTTSHNQGGSNGGKTLDGEGFLPNQVAASRFLAQATLGADYESIIAMSNATYAEWIDSQFLKPQLISVEDFMKTLLEEAVDSTFAMGGDPNDIYPQTKHWLSAWWQYVMTSPDLLRARVALALSEIFVISEVPVLNEVPLGLASYYDMLLENSFGNFRTLLDKVTLHPCMGVYLTHMNNPKSDSTLNRFPDENYAREVMQLFTIGLYQMNPDGTRQLDTAGNFIPTYDNDDIAEFAKVFTGLTWGDAFLFGQDPISELSYTVPMIMKNAWHEPGEKHLLNGFIVPNRTPVNGMLDIKDALDNLFNHPNVGPFIARLLIQRLVTSNPTHAYIGRVAAAFNNNGQGVRGDMKAVVKAILLDDEARNCAFISDPNRGMLREPIVRYSHAARAFNAYSDRGVYRNRMDEFWNNTSQRPLASPSVFNFFQPDYQPIGPIDDANLVAPEFQITNSVTIVGYANRLYEWIMREDDVMEYTSFWSGEWYGDKLVYLELTDEMAFDGVNEIGSLLERLNLILFHGQMSADTRTTIRTALEQVPQNNWEERVRLAIYLSMISPDYLILR